MGLNIELIKEMKAMKIYRFFLLSCSITLLAASCQEMAEEPSGGYSTEGLKASIVDEETVTRSIVVDNPGIKLESFWKAGDKIGLFGQQATNTQLSIDASTISKDGKEATFNALNGVPSGELLAYHPYMDNASGSGNVLQLSFPATQHYTLVSNVAQPDPDACVIVGKGSKGIGISFKNVMAVLKIGQVFAKQTTVKSIEFRDLSGKSVSGSYSVDMSQGVPVTEFTGDGKVITLDLGEGQEISEGGRLIAFMVVPARQYPKGFELTFVDADGQKTVRTVGSKNGKTLNRSVVHPVGDFGDYSNIPGMTYELKPTAVLMTPDKLDLITVTGNAKYYVKDDDGNDIYVDENGNAPLFLPQLELIAHKDLNPQVGGWLIFNTPSDDLPQGGIYRITECSPSADGNHFVVKTRPETDFARAFENLTIGTPLYDSEGNLQEDGGIELDLAPYIKEIEEKDENGNVVNRSPQHQIPTYDMNVADQMTRGSVSHTYEPPALTLSMDDGKHCSCEVSAKAHIKVRIAIGIIAGELQYIYTTCNPKFDLTTKFSLYEKYEGTRRQHIWTFYTSGIPIGPILLMPEIAFDGFLGISGEMKFTASTKFSYDLGTYGLAYNKGDGLSFRRMPPPPPAPKDDFYPELGAGTSFSLGAYGGIGMRAGVSVYAMCSLGAATDFKLNFGLSHEKGTTGYSSYADWKPNDAISMQLTPEIDITPYTAVIGGKFSKLWKGLQAKVEFDPLWQRFITPVSVEGDRSVIFSKKDLGPMVICNTPFDHVMVPDGVTGVAYYVKLKEKTILPCNVTLELLEGSGIGYGWDEEFNKWWSNSPEAYESSSDKPNTYNTYFTPSQYLTTGLPLYWMAANCSNGASAGLISPYNVVESHVIGQYKAETDGEQVFEGVCPISTSSGHYYGLQISVAPAISSFSLPSRIVVPMSWHKLYGESVFEY